LLGIQVCARAQELKKAKTDSIYIADFSDALTLRFFSTYESNRFEMRSGRSGQVFAFEPDNALRVGVGANHKRMGFNLNFKLPNLQSSNYKKREGNTNEFTLQAFLFYRKFGGDIALRRYSGLFWANYNELNRDRPSFYYPFLSEIRVNELSGNIFYITNHRKFSFRSLFIQDERQVKSSATMLFGVSANRMKFVNDENQDSSIYDLFSVTDYAVNQFGLLWGVAGNLCVKKNLILSGTFINSLMQKNTLINFRNSPRNTAKTPSLFLRFNIDASYSQKKYFCGISFSSNDYLIHSDNAVRRFQSQFRVFGGLRFFSQSSVADADKI
jgi:hypothetical protein